jgi:hypothetical protein
VLPPPQGASRRASPARVRDKRLSQRAAREAGFKRVSDLLPKRQSVASPRASAQDVVRRMPTSPWGPFRQVPWGTSGEKDGNVRCSSEGRPQKRPRALQGKNWGWSDPFCRKGGGRSSPSGSPSVGPGVFAKCRSTRELLPVAIEHWIENCIESTPELHLEPAGQFEGSEQRLEARQDRD